MIKKWQIKMSDISICPVSENDIDDILKISQLSFSVAWSRESFSNELNNSLARYIVIKCDNHALGYGGMWIILDEAHITNIAVHPDFRGIGIGDRIVEGLISICRAEKIPSITLEVRSSNIIAQNLYKKYGFVQEGTRKHYYEDNKEDAIIMWNRSLI